MFYRDKTIIYYLFGRTAQMPNEADAKKFLTTCPPEITKTSSYNVVVDYTETQAPLPE